MDRLGSLDAACERFKLLIKVNVLPTQRLSGIPVLALLLSSGGMHSSPMKSFQGGQSRNVYFDNISFPRNGRENFDVLVFVAFRVPHSLWHATCISPKYF
jgi:hypothetical protein